jgi:hypothetical protein
VACRREPVTDLPAREWSRRRAFCSVDPEKSELMEHPVHPPWVRTIGLFLRRPVSVGVVYIPTAFARWTELN